MKKNSPHTAPPRHHAEKQEERGNRALCRRVLLAVQKSLAGEKPLVVAAFSGGADSTALALALKQSGVPFVLAHLNHRIRPESEEEAALKGPVQRMAKALGVPCECGRADVRALAASTGAGLEEAGRSARYAFLEKIRRTYGAVWILLAHHADDLVEDVLLRLVRGAGWPALGGMPALDAQRHLLRPFLELPKSDLEAFASLHGTGWLHDASNESDEFRRNRLRHHTLPLLFAENPALRRTIGRLWELAREDERFWETYLSPIAGKCLSADDTACLEEAQARTLPRAARLRLFARLVAHVGRGKGQARAETLFALDNALLAPQRPKYFQFPGGITATLHGGFIRFTRS